MKESWATVASIPALLAARAKITPLVRGWRRPEATNRPAW